MKEKIIVISCYIVVFIIMVTCLYLRFTNVDLTALRLLITYWKTYLLMVILLFSIGIILAKI